MKTTLWKQVGLSIILLPVCNTMYAKSSQQQHESLLAYLYVTNAVLHDSLIVKTSSTKNLIIPTVQLQSPVRGFVEQYLEDHAAMLNNIKERNRGTFKTIQKILVKRGIPAELMYLAVVESKLKNSATSDAGAAGVWQLMPVTARSLGLRVEGRTDERRYLYKSSAAAADYLVELYKQFDDWLLVIAAYNCGSGNVDKAIKQSGSREFWKLQHFLPTETRNHVKRFIATHYYYEGEGSLATLTKTERNNYLASIIDIEKENYETDSTPASSNQQLNWVLIAQHEGEIIMLLRK